MNNDLIDQAERFCSEIEALVETCLPSAPDFEMEQRNNKLVWIRPVAQTDREGGIPLFAGGAQHGWLRVNYHCRADAENEFLAIHRSKFSVWTTTENPPLFRFEYDSDAAKKADAHIHVHGERPALAGFLASARYRKLQQLHLPTGGARFRNGIEDVIEFLITDCDIDARAGWCTAVKTSRDQWWETQLKAATRRMPAVAAEQLRSMGYQIMPPAAV